MAHQLNVQGGRYLRPSIQKGKPRYSVIEDPQNPNFEILIPYDQRMFKGLKVNFEGQIVEIGYKFVRVQPSVVYFYEEENV